MIKGNDLSAIKKFGKDAHVGVRCGEGYDNSPYASGNWFVFPFKTSFALSLPWLVLTPAAVGRSTLKAGFMFKRRRGGEAWRKRWIILQVGAATAVVPRFSRSSVEYDRQVGRVLWGTSDEEAPTGASTIWSVDARRKSRSAHSVYLDGRYASITKGERGKADSNMGKGFRNV